MHSYSALKDMGNVHALLMSAAYSIEHDLSPLHPVPKEF